MGARGRHGQPRSPPGSTLGAPVRDGPPAASPCTAVQRKCADLPPGCVHRPNHTTCRCLRSGPPVDRDALHGHLGHPESDHSRRRGGRTPISLSLENRLDHQRQVPCSRGTYVDPHPGQRVPLRNRPLVRTAVGSRACRPPRTGHRQEGSQRAVLDPRVRCAGRE